MAFIFPEDKNDFTAPNGIIYRWDGTKWVVKAFRSTEDFIVDLGDDPPDNPKEGDLWYDTREEQLTLYIWTGKVWVPAAPPVSLDGIEASIANVDAELMKVNANIAINKSEADGRLLDLDESQAKQDEAIDYLSRESTQLRSRISDVEFGQSKQDERLDALEKEEDDTQARLFGSPYVFRDHKEPNNLAKGEFTYDDNYNWYAHRYDSAGDRIGISFEDKYTADGMFKVYQHNGAINLIVIMHRFEVCRTGQGPNDHFKWEKRQAAYTHFEWLIDGDTYYLSDGYLLPQ